MTTEGDGIAESSGNVFADIGVENADEALAKAKIAHAVAVTIRQRRMSQVRAAEVLGIDQPKVSALMRGHLAGFSLERMLRFLVALRLDVEISVRKPVAGSSRRPGRLVVSTDLADAEIV